MLPKNTLWGRCVYCSSVNTCQLVYYLSINEVSVDLLFKMDMFFAPSHDDTEQFVKFHHYTLGPHESMGHM